MWKAPHQDSFWNRGNSNSNVTYLSLLFTTLHQAINILIPFINSNTSEYILIA